VLRDVDPRGETGRDARSGGIDRRREEHPGVAHSAALRPVEGRVLIDGQDVRRATIASVRDSVAFVLQDPFLLPMSIAENIAYGRPSATRAEVEAAARSPTRTSSSSACRSATTPSSVSVASRSRAASGSGSRSRGRC